MSDYIEENCFALLLSSDRADLLMKEEPGTGITDRSRMETISGSRNGRF